MGPRLNQSKFSAKKKQRRANGKQCNFDWDPEEDTSRPQDPNRKEEAPPPAPRGFEDVEPSVLRQADLIRKYDPETGEERARQFLEQYKAGQAHINRTDK